MRRLDELGLPLDEELYLEQAALWLVQGIRPVPSLYHFELGSPSEFHFFADLEALDALFVALASGMISARGICWHTEGPVKYPELIDKRPADDVDIDIAPSAWHKKEINWLNSEFRVPDLAFKISLIRLPTKQLLSAFPSLSSSESALKHRLASKRAEAASPMPDRITTSVAPSHSGDRPSRKREATKRAVKALYPQGIPSRKGATILAEVNQWLTSQGDDPIGRDTLDRVLERRRD